MSSVTSKVQTENTTCAHSYLLSQNVEVTEIESKLMVIRGWGEYGGERRERG
jgi:hypothetical protein